MGHPWCVGSSWETPRNLFLKILEDLTSFGWDILFTLAPILKKLLSNRWDGDNFWEDGVILYVLDHLGRPPGTYPWSFVKIWLHLAEIFWSLWLPYWKSCRPTDWMMIISWRMGSSLMCWIFLEDPQELILEVLWRSDFIWLRYFDHFGSLIEKVFVQLIGWW